MTDELKTALETIMRPGFGEAPVLARVAELENEIADLRALIKRCVPELVVRKILSFEQAEAIYSTN